jgi:pimeloyl-ACP methyl ester carboxylesterase
MHTAAGNAKGVYYESYGIGVPLILGFPLQASMAEIMGDAGSKIKQGFLDRLVDRYQVVLVDYPCIGKSDDIAPDDFTVKRASDDMLAVADRLGIDKFIWWGYTVGAAIGLHLAWQHQDRLRGLVIGGWPPIDGQYEIARDAALEAKDNPPKEAMVILRNPSQYAQWATFYDSARSFPEQQQLKEITIPRVVFIGDKADVGAGHTKWISHATVIKEHQNTLRQYGWNVELIEGREGDVSLDPQTIVPIVTKYMDSW